MMSVMDRNTKFHLSSISMNPFRYKVLFKKEIHLINRLLTILWCNAFCFSVENRRRETLFEPLILAYTKNYVVKLKERGHTKIVQNTVVTKISLKFRRKYKRDFLSSTLHF
jgi:hypothetical protein